MMIDPKSTAKPSAFHVMLTLSVVGLGLAPLPAGWARTARESVRSQELNQGDREANAGGYYEGLISGAAKNNRGAPSPLEIALIGKPINQNREMVKRITVDLDRDFLQFELKANHDEVFFEHRFTTNSQGMRDREYSRDKPAGTFRVALLGSSIDMGWGVDTDDTYENLLETWLNAEATRRGISRRFEVLNFSMAAYGPAQRYEALHRKALAFHPDLVLFSSTMIDPRLLEIHLGGLIKNRVDLKYDFFRQAARAAGIDPKSEGRDAWSELDRKGGFKAKVKDHYWIFADAVMGALAADCRSLDLPMAALLVPRACRDDASDARALVVARQSGISARHAVPLIDLSATFDHRDASEVEVAPGDDHPNALGHRLLFESLSKALMADPELARTLFDDAGPPATLDNHERKR